jgi:hypothetical protein
MKKRFIMAVAASAAAAVLGLTPGTANAADGDRLLASTPGAAIGLTVHWVDANHFVLQDVYLRDTGCNESNKIHFHVQVPGYQFPDHTAGGAGCSSTNYPSLPGSYGYDIPYISVKVCRNVFPADNCSTSGNSDNPYV